MVLNIFQTSLSSAYPCISWEPQFLAPNDWDFLFVGKYICVHTYTVSALSHQDSVWLFFVTHGRMQRPQRFLEIVSVHFTTGCILVSLKLICLIYMMLKKGHFLVSQHPWCSTVLGFLIAYLLCFLSLFTSLMFSVSIILIIMYGIN